MNRLRIVALLLPLGALAVWGSCAVYPITSDFLCGDASTYGSLKALICKSLDITSFPQNDNTNAPCDALSIALGFAARTAKLGPVMAGVAPTQPCGAQWTDECK